MLEYSLKEQTTFNTCMWTAKMFLDFVGGEGGGGGGCGFVHRPMGGSEMV